MRRLLRCVTIVALCCAAGPAAAAERSAARPREVESLFEEALRLYEQGRAAEALVQAGKALALRESMSGSTSPNTDNCLDLLGAFRFEQEDLANCLDLLGSLRLEQQQLERAEALYKRALALREASLGATHPAVAASLTHLADLASARATYARAEPLYVRALALREAALGRNHPEVAATLDALATLYTRQAQYAKAEPLYQRALAIREAALGRNAPEVAATLDHLAGLYAEQALYTRAEPLAERALALWEAARGKDHPDVARALDTLAGIHRAQGFYARAEPLYVRALGIREAALGDNHLLVAETREALGGLYKAQGQYARAEPLYRRALGIREAALGGNHPEVAALLNDLADFYTAQKSYQEAERLYRRALVIREATLGDNHPRVAQTVNNLATLYFLQGQYARAEPLYARALALREAALGKDHPDVAEALHNLALSGLARYGPFEAMPLFSHAFAVSERRLRQEALDLSESRLTSFLQLLRAEEDLLFVLLGEYPDEARVRQLALSAALLFKGRSVAEIADTSRTIYRSLKAEDREVFARLRGLRARLARLSLQGPGPLPLADHQRRLRELTEQGDALEADLARRSAPLRSLAALPQPDAIVGRVAASLPHDSALVEFIAYTDTPGLPRVDPSRPVHRGQLRYLALVLFPDGRTRAQELGPADRIDTAATHLRDALANRDANVQVPAQALYQLAFQPLLPLLGDTRRLYLSPDGQLGLVPFAALHDGTRFLVDAFDFTYLTSGRDLLRRPEDTPSARSVVVFADPAFRMALRTPPTVPANETLVAERSLAVAQFFSTLRADVAEQPWTPLPGTRQEAEAIHRLVPQAQVFLGADASKERLLRLPTPGVLHVATHGFFMEDAPASGDTRAVGYFGALGNNALAPRPPDPLLRSGLVLAGARASESDEPGGGTFRPESSLVTALELAGLNLWGTELVVLSACDTGRGDVKLGQGVYGLRRAFVAAGAETVVTSLWKVNDDITRHLMEAYYRNLITGQGRAVALREAMRTLRATRPHPHDWAPFIVLGQDAPLRAFGRKEPEK